MNDKNCFRKQPWRLSTPVRLGVAAVAACFISGPALSNPLNPTVINGTAAFSQAGNVLTVTNSPGAIINWQKFSIQAGETTHFAQTSASSSVLNRVLSDPSAIYGTLSSNGRVWLVNPAGIMVGPGGRVDVAGFVASTLNISNADFLAGRNVFINDGNAKNVINQGEIRTPAGGSVYLIGSNVSNEGLITTPQGETLLAAGATVSLIDSATPGVKVDITGAEGNATNLGTITAEAGRIGIAGVIVRNSGMLNASSVVNEGGRIFLKASQDAYVDGNGRIVTTGTRGGSVEVLGNRVAVMDSAEIDASGTNGGGRILVGGDYQGRNPEIQNASVTYFGPDATLKADATEVGDGGTVIVWADDTTRGYGNISARGGANGGNGGFVETSGKQYLDVAGIKVSTAAANGMAGTWLLDPTDITIVHSTSTGNATFTGSIFNIGGGSTATLNDFDINANLASNNITINTNSVYGGTGDITFNGSANGAIVITNSTGTGRTLTLTADNNVIFYGGATTFNTTGTGSSLGINFDLAANRKVEVQPGATVTFDGASGGLVGAYIGGAALGRSWENFGTINLNGVSYIDLYVSSYSEFKNKPGGVLNVNSTQGWPIQSISSTQDGKITNEGVVNFNGTGAFEAQYDQKPGGALNLVGAALLSMQNAGTIYGGVNIGAGGRLVISEQHAGPRTFYGASIAGPGILDVAQPTTFIDSTMSNGVLAKTNGNLNIPSSGLSFTGGMTFASSSSVGFSSGFLNLVSLNVLAGWDGSGFTFADVVPGVGDINIAGSSIFAGTTIDLHAGRNITLGQTGTGSVGTSVQSNGLMSVSATNLSLLGGSLSPFNISSSQGPGVMLRSLGGQTIDVENQILLQAGSANSSYGGGNPFYGGSVAIVSDAEQTVSAKFIRVRAGAGGHDNSAEIQAYGSQTINIIGTGGQLEITGGGTAGSYNNQARVQHGRWTGPNSYEGVGSQIVNVYGGGSVVIAAGSGDGTLGYYDAQCGIACSGTSSSNGADIENLIGSQTLDFISSGSLTVTGGSAGTSNWGAVENSGIGSQAINGSPNITLTGGSAGGGTVFYGGEFFEQTNDAGIYTEGGGNQLITAGTLTINGGNATYGGAGISHDGPSGLMLINTTGDVIMTGGASNAAHPYATPAAIHSEGASLYLSVGGNLSIAGGSGSSGPAIIGSAIAPVNVDVSAGKDIVATGNTGGVLLGMRDGINGGSVSLSAGGYSADGGNISLNGPVRVQAGYADLYARASSTGANGNITQTLGSSISSTGGAYGVDVSIQAEGSVTLDGSVTASYGDIFASAGLTGGGEVAYSSSLFGGSLSLGSTSNILALTGIDLQSSRNITINGPMTSTIGAININAGLGYTGFFGLSSSPFGGNVVVGGNIYAYGGSIDVTANVGYSSLANGNVTQNSGGNIIANNMNISAGGSVTLDGTVSAPGGYVFVNAGYQDAYFGGQTPNGGNISVGGALSGNGVVGLFAEAGYSSGFNGNITQSAGSITADSGDVIIIATGAAAIGSINAPTGFVDIDAGGAIYDNNGTALNITADSINLGSQYGGVAGGLAISMDTSATSGLSGYVAPGATFGGISIRNFGVQSGIVSIEDWANSQSAINFYNSGDLTLSTTLISPGGLKIGSGGILNIGSGAVVSGYDVTLNAPTVNITGGSDVFAVNNVSVTGSEININGGFVTATNIYFNGSTPGTGNLNLFGGVAAASGQLDFNLGNVTASYGGGLAADGLTSNITGTVSGNITLDQGAFFAAGNDIRLTLTGASSTISLSNGAYMLADYITQIPATIYLSFLARSSGGVLINGVATTASFPGGSGFFVLDQSTPAVAGAGLEIVYGTPVVVDPCVSSPDLCLPPVAIENPILQVVELVAVDPCASNPDSVECKLQVPGDEDKEASFGGQEESGIKDEKWTQKTIPQCGI